MSNHTQGPWITFDDPRNSIHGTKTVHVIPAAPGPTIATLSGKGVGPMADRLVDGDARLIAAAPDLLALAERIARLNRDAVEIGASLVDDARAAVSRATGEDA